MPRISKSNKTNKIDLKKARNEYIRYLLDYYGKNKYIEEENGNTKGFNNYKSTMKCMTSKCNNDIDDYLQSDILASRERANCISPFDSKCIKKIRSKYRQHDKLAKLIHCKTNKCISRNKMLSGAKAFLEHDWKQQCMQKDCSTNVSDYRARKILAHSEIEWQCNKDNDTAHKQYLCERQKTKKWYQANRDNELQKLSDNCFRKYCATK